MKSALAMGVALLLVGTALGGTLSQTPFGPFIDPIPTVIADPGDVTHDYDVTGTESWDGYQDVDNVVVLYDLAAALGLPSGTPVTMTGIGWNVNLTAYSPSYLSEIKVYFDDAINPDGTGLFLTPGVADPLPGSGSYDSGGLIDLTDNGIDDIPLADGILRLEFYEGFDDFADDIDGLWDSGFLTIVSTPEPSSLLLLGLGLVGFLRRR